MIALDDLRSLPLNERLQLVADLWDSIAEDQQSLPDDLSVVDELRARKARFEADPSSGVSWDKARELSVPTRNLTGGERGAGNPRLHQARRPGFPTCW